MPTHPTRQVKLPKFVTNLPDLNFGGSVADWNFPNLLVMDWIEILASIRPIQPTHTPN